jgi:tetratricopeptide (TPR) repeat protein
MMTRPNFKLTALPIATLLVLALGVPNAISAEKNIARSTTVIAQAQKNDGIRLLKEGYEQYKAKQYSDAIATFQQAIPALQAAGDRKGEAYALRFMALSLQLLDRDADAVVAFERALPLFQAEKEQGEVGHVFSGLGFSYMAVSRDTDAIRAFEQAVPIFRALKDKDCEGPALLGLGVANMKVGRYAQAIQPLEQSITAFQELNDQKGVAMAKKALDKARQLANSK